MDKLIIKKLSNLFILYLQFIKSSINCPLSIKLHLTLNGQFFSYFLCIKSYIETHYFMKNTD